MVKQSWWNSDGMVTRVAGMTWVTRLTRVTSVTWVPRVSSQVTLVTQLILTRVTGGARVAWVSRVGD